MLKANLKLTDVLGAIWPFLLTLAVLLISLPLARVRVVALFISAHTLHHVTIPLALVHAAVRPNPLAGAVALVCVPLTLVHAAVRPDPLPIAVTKAASPLASVGGTITKLELGAGLKLQGGRQTSARLAIASKEL
eukprot:CAMPEP_0115666446 /NCGR_PEP_ID=MMETSP0272-20121206/49420_1 /TAXON_ID=71861 /ORGANISM="Scrippsiella trochoidea, Strain CCMP3099" /LENGTH=134 /DNA_ID=CAMNT_0003104945 /DNA_START=371 /DNA_END=772 /DNA_ORIENTATION=+